MARPTVSFNGFDLASNVIGLAVVASNPYRAPNRDLSVSHLANTDKSALSSVYMIDKKINVTVEIGRTTRELFDASIDQLYTILQTKEAALVCSYGSTTRQWTATLNNVSVEENLGGYGTIELEFQCSDPAGYDVSSTPLFSSARTGSTATENFVFGGTAEWQWPVITITLTAVTPTDSTQSITITNPATGQAITVTRAWVAADVLQIDVKNRTVKVNGNEVAFSGAFPEWVPGAGTLQYTDTLTTRTVTIAGSYYKRYM